MATMDTAKEVCLDIHWEIVDKCNGFALDFGGSVCKFIYLHNDDWCEPKDRSKDTVCLRCTGISRDKFDDALAFLKTNAFLKRDDKSEEKPLIHITGVGGARMEKTISETFDIKTSTSQEFECFVRAFRYLVSNKTQEEITEKLDIPFLEKNLADMKQYVNFVRTAFKKDCHNMIANVTSEVPTFPMEWPFEASKNFTEYENLFPCLLVMVGSNGGAFLVNEDGKYQIAAGLKRAGRTFIGVASLLTKSKSYEELMNKAERGDMSNIHEYVGDITKGIDSSKQGGDSSYSEMAKLRTDAPIFAFGKTAFKDPDSFSSDDIALSYLQLACSDIVQTVHSQLRVYPKVKHVFFCGGFPNHPLTRNIITQEWMRRDGSTFAMSGQKEFARLHFLKHGQHLGALGAYLTPHFQSS